MLHILKIAGFILLGVLAVALFDIVVIFTIAMVRVVSERREKKERRSENCSRFFRDIIEVRSRCYSGN